MDNGILDDVLELFPGATLVRIYKGQDDGIHDGAGGEVAGRAADDRRELARRRALEGLQDPGQQSTPIPEGGCAEVPPAVGV